MLPSFSRPLTLLLPSFCRRLPWLHLRLPAPSPEPRFASSRIHKHTGGAAIGRLAERDQPVSTRASEQMGMLAFVALSLCLLVVARRAGRSTTFKRLRRAYRRRAGAVAWRVNHGDMSAELHKEPLPYPAEALKCRNCSYWESQGFSTLPLHAGALHSRNTAPGQQRLKASWGFSVPRP